MVPTRGQPPSCRHHPGHPRPRPAGRAFPGITIPAERGRGRPGWRLHEGALDGLRRTLYVSGFSKAISPSLRAGYVVADAAITRELARTKMAVALTSSEITERIVHAFVTRPVYAEHVARLIARLGEAHTRVEALMRQHGAEPFDTPGRGLFLWARLPGQTDASALANRAIEHNIWLAPGQYFRPHDEPSPWLRFNVAYSAEPALWEFLSHA